MMDSNLAPARTSAAWLQVACEQHSHLNRELLQQALHFVDKHQGDATVAFADSALQQGLMMADDLIELECDNRTIAAAIVYPTLFYHPDVQITEVQKNLGNAVYKLVLGAQKMEAIHKISKESADQDSSDKIDNIRKMLLAMVDDVRVVLIKLVDRLAILRYLKHVDREHQLRIAEQTHAIYAPLANRLGIGQLKWQLEDLSFRFMNPEEYASISKSLNMRRQDREQFIDEMIERLANLFKDAGIQQPNITGRAKHIYSIHKKIQRKHIGFSEVYDASALRVLVNNIPECYNALSIVHNEWQHIDSEFDDYIANPKENGYQSIHTAVVGHHNINVEIQIRTVKMHDDAELGVAAHWKYKEGQTATDSYEDKIAWLREIMDWQQELTDEDQGDSAYSQIFRDRVYIFTPNGDVFDLPAGATPLDFAYHIHTDVGHRCRGAKVNGKLVQLTHQLRTGDQVSITTGKESKPSRDWLNPTLGYIKTNQAKNKIRHWLKRQNYQQDLHAGQAIWEKAWRRAQLDKNAPNECYKHFNFKSANDLLAALGSGHIHVGSITHYFRDQQQPMNTDEASVDKPSVEANTQGSSHLIIEGVGDLLSQLARCCKPIPGDTITGYITKGRGVTIHQQSCRNIQHVLSQCPERMIEVNWGEKAPHNYTVDLKLITNNRNGLIHDISNVILADKIPLLGINTQRGKGGQHALVHLTIEISGITLLQKVTNQLQQIPDVIKVLRE